MVYNYDNTGYLPHDELSRLVTYQKIRTALQDAALTQWVCDHACKIFAILVMIDAIERIRDCKTQGFTDENLPILSKFDRLATRAVGEEHMFHFEILQWPFLSPILTTQDMDIENIPVVYAKTPLPFKPKDHYTAGGFSNVYKCQIQPGGLQATEVSTWLSRSCCR